MVCFAVLDPRNISAVNMPIERTDFVIERIYFQRPVFDSVITGLFLLQLAFESLVLGNFSLQLAFESLVLSNATLWVISKRNHVSSNNNNEHLNFLSIRYFSALVLSRLLGVCGNFFTAHVVQW